jgi:AcrR family transcriptional regulator
MKDTKEIILKTAYNMFLYNNYEAVTINSILHATGLTKGGIYHYYVSKEELFKAVVDKYMLESRADSEIEYQSLKDLIENTIIMLRGKMTNLAKENPNFHNEIPINYLSLLVAAYRYYPGYAEIGNTFFKSQKEKWRKTIEKAIKEKEIRNNIDVEAEISIFMHIGSSIVSNMIMEGSINNAIDLLERQYWELYYNIKK